MRCFLCTRRQPNDDIPSIFTQYMMIRDLTSLTYPPTTYTTAITVLLTPATCLCLSIHCDR